MRPFKSRANKLRVDKWQVILVDEDLEVIWSEPLSLEDARNEAAHYNNRTLLVQERVKEQYGVKEWVVL